MSVPIAHGYRCPQPLAVHPTCQGVVGWTLHHPGPTSSEPRPTTDLLHISSNSLNLSGPQFPQLQNEGTQKVVTRLQQMKGASFRPRTQWVLPAPASLPSLPFRDHAPEFQECQTCLDRALAFTAKAATCPRLLQRAHTLSAHMCTHGHMHTHSHLYILHIFARVTAGLTHTMVTQSVPTTGLSSASFPPKLLESSNPQGTHPTNT